MGKVYSPPAEIGDFNVDISKITNDEYFTAEAAYVQKIKDFAIANGNGELRGFAFKLRMATPDTLCTRSSRLPSFISPPATAGSINMSTA